MADYNKTINLPKTDFPMRAALAKREPGMLEEMNRKDLYHKLMDRNKDKKPFILHDGPPYANGDIHIGTAMNKILKDFIIRYRNMTGYYAPYVPGWDTHGMPIETAIQKKGVKRSTMPVPEFRDKCRAFALDFLDRQREQFKRLGGIGDWEKPYVTLKPEFEAEQIKVFGAMAAKNYIYQGLKPVYWCPTCETALAEAEVEYADDPVTTIFVKFKVHDDKGKLSQYGDLDKMFFVIWTTTTWTLPGNMAICLNPQLEYSLVKIPTGEILIVATDLVKSVMDQSGIAEYETVATMFGDEFEYMTAYHPFMNRDSLVILGDHVTLDAGSGCVHTAPSFGLDDFYVCQRYDSIPTDVEMEVSVNARGVLNEFAGPYAGLHVTKAHPVIFKDLVDMGAILSSADIVHSYPHCWRCKKPIIFRATQQWFASVDAIKDAAVDACDNIQWKPEWGKERMVSMIRERSDWCISRQRTWGVPIPIFFCKDCGKPYCTEASIQKVSDIFRVEGSNAWWAKEAAELMPEGAKCDCGCTEFTKEKDIMDVWFDSGSTWAAVCDQNPEHPELSYPADLYLEGGDQYRGWFQSSLLVAVGALGKGAPYRECLTHGWTVDGEGKAMHKSLGNGMDPAEIINEFGADMLRLWAGSADYHADMRCSKEIFKQLTQNYLKFRNTARYCLGNLDGFDAEHLVAPEDMLPLDRWAITKLNDLIRRVAKAYDNYEFHVVSHAINDFCVVELSSFYLDIIKDRLYCEERNGLKRRSAQTALFLILDSMTKMFAPILAFTCDEIWLAMPHRAEDDARNVLLNVMNQPFDAYALSEDELAKWDQLIRVRTDVNGVLEAARAEKRIGKPLEAAVTLRADDDAARAALDDVQSMNLPELLIVSQCLVGGDVPADAVTGTGTNFPGLHISVRNAPGTKCPRCWMHSEQADPETGLCPRCAAVVAAQKAE